MIQYDVDVDGPKGGGLPTWKDKSLGDTTGVGQGLRFNKGKTRFDLLEPHAIEQLAKVFTKGAEKYEDNNWLKGMSWSSVVASLKRHLSAFEQGIDFDEETELLHMAHVAWNAMAIVSYYKHFPQGDNRFAVTKPIKRIGLDIDEVLADWLGAWCKHWSIPRPQHWSFHRGIIDKFAAMKKDGSLDEMYLNLDMLTKPEDIPFDVHCYVTSRPVSTEITEQWLDKNGYPVKPVITVGVGQSKVQALKDAGVDIFVDDRYENFMELNKAGILCYLFDQPHNRKYNVGHKRIKNLKELPL
jgi:5'(3')-deoxyribonucleotidase